MFLSAHLLESLWINNLALNNTDRFLIRQMTVHIITRQELLRKLSWHNSFKSNWCQSEQSWNSIVLFTFIRADFRTRRSRHVMIVGCTLPMIDVKMSLHYLQIVLVIIMLHNWNVICESIIFIIDAQSIIRIGYIIYVTDIEQLVVTVYMSGWRSIRLISRTGLNIAWVQRWGVVNREIFRVGKRVLKREGIISVIAYLESIDGILELLEWV